MFDSALLTALNSDSQLIADLSTFEGAPAIFSNTAPEDVDFNYIVFQIIDTGNGTIAVDDFSIMIDFFGYAASGVTARRAVKRIVDILDRAHLTHSDFATIRLFKSGIDYIETNDIKSQHYNVRFSARAGRSGWMDNF